MTRHRLSWLAAEDGIAHCHTSAHTTACGARPVILRWSWPALDRCGRCVAAVAREHDAAVPLPLPEAPPDRAYPTSPPNALLPTASRTRARAGFVASVGDPFFRKDTP